MPYYARRPRRTAAFDREREDYLKRLAACEASHEYTHSLEWQLHKRADEVRTITRGALLYIYICVCVWDIRSRRFKRRSRKPMTP